MNTTLQPCRAGTSTPEPNGKTKCRKPTGKATTIEIERRIEVAGILLCQRRTRTQIHQTFAREYAGISWRQTDRYLARARERLIAATGMTKDELRNEAYHFCLHSRICG